MGEKVRYRPGKFFEEIQPRLEAVCPGLKVGAWLAIDLPEIYIDREQVTSILEKLVECGARLSPPGNVIVIEARPGGGGVLLSVTDRERPGGKRFNFSFTVPVVRPA